MGWNPTQTCWKKSALSTRTAKLLTRDKFAIQQDTSLKARCPIEYKSSVSITQSSPSQLVNYKEECLICGRTRTTKGDRSLLLISTLDRQKSVWDNGKEIGNEDMLYRICGSDNKCPDMVADDFQLQRVCINAYIMTMHVHSQAKACPSTHTSHLRMVSS